MGAWKRPSSVPPQIWLREKGFIVRDVTPDLDDFVIEHMVENLCRDAPLSKSAELYKDEASLDDMRWLWRDLTLPQRVSLVALAEGTPGADMKPVTPENPPAILGANALFVSTKLDPELEIFEKIKGSVFRKISFHTERFSHGIDIYDMFKINQYLDAFGLSVGRSNRGQGIGELLLRARQPLCERLGILATKTVFTSAAAQKIASRVGFKVVKEMLYSEMTDFESGRPAFPDLCDGVQTIQLSVWKFH